MDRQILKVAVSVLGEREHENGVHACLQSREKRVLGFIPRFPVNSRSAAYTIIFQIWD